MFGMDTWTQYNFSQTNQKLLKLQNFVETIIYSPKVI